MLVDNGQQSYITSFCTILQRWGRGAIWEGFFSPLSVTSLQPQHGEMMARFRARGISCWPASHAGREKKRHHTVIVKQTGQAGTKWCQQLRHYDVNPTQQLNWGSRSFHIVYS